ncbi:hypothetical protein Ahy_B01g054782 [Arachis hypogaea]|uniref:Cullin N-terminal domain-containing protein n=1 Tax=Arachis hypogaea TaxID=3818 RepID=A0A445AUG1_ARAHY|nr:hypothetical protein Ahy_B01g054782 [Arachis hypogaea]
MSLIRKALELIEDDQSTYVVLHRHLLRTVAAPMVDMLLHDLDEQNKLKNGVELQDAPSSESISVSPGDRVAISKSFPRPLAVADKALAVVEALEGKVGISNFTTNLLVKLQPVGNHTNPSTVSLHHRRKEWNTAAVRRTQSSPSVALKVRHLASLVLQVFNPSSLSPIAAASSSSASIVFVCSAVLPSSFSCGLRSRSSPFTFARRSPFAFTRSSPFELAFVWKPRCSASNSATNPRDPPSRRTTLFCHRNFGCVICIFYPDPPGFNEVGISYFRLTEREGGQIDRSLLKNIVDIFVEVGLGKLDHYEQDFEIQMLDDTANYYKSKCTLWTEVDSFQESLWKANASRIGP